MKPKKKLNRREFAKLAGGAALAVPVAVELLETSAYAQTPAAQTQQPQEAPKPEWKLTAEQEERVKQARERSERQMRGLRERPIPYDAEPAFTFRARPAARRKS